MSVWRNPMKRLTIAAGAAAVLFFAATGAQAGERMFPALGKIATPEQIKAWKSERTQVRKQHKAKVNSFEQHLNAAVDALDEPAAAELVGTIPHNDLKGILERYIRQQRQQVIAAFETWSHLEQGYSQAIYDFNLSVAKLEKVTGGLELSLDDTTSP